MTDRDAQWGIVKGWLIAKEAPDEIVRALEALREAGPIHQATAAKPRATLLARSDLGTQELPVIDPDATCDIPATEPPARKKRNWSPEARAAAAERMRARNAVKKETPMGEHRA